MLLWLFIKSNFKYIAPLLLVVGAFFYASHLIDNAYERGELAGEITTNKKWEEVVKEKDKEYRQLEVSNARTVDSFGKTVERLKQERAEVSRTYTHTIEQVLASDPRYLSCTATPELITELNNIRRQGPE